MFERIGKVESTMLGTENHGITTFSLSFDFGGSGQSFGGYALDDWNEKEERRIGTAAGMDAIMQILKVCDVESWEDIAGKTLYALYENDSYGQMIKGIKGLPWESNKTFLINEWQKKWYPEEVGKIKE